MGVSRSTDRHPALVGAFPGIAPVSEEPESARRKSISGQHMAFMFGSKSSPKSADASLTRGGRRSVRTTPVSKK